MRDALIEAIIIFAVCIGCYIWGHSNGVDKQQLAQMKIQQKSDSKIDDMQKSVDAKDLQIAGLQQKQEDVRTVEVIKQQVIYRDKIKTIATRKCVADSGLLQLYDKSLGLSDNK